MPLGTKHFNQAEDPAAAPRAEVVKIAPQPGPQTALLSCPISDILFGGARGGGKSYGILLHWWDHAEEYGRSANGLLVRRTYPELEDIISKAKEMYTGVADWKEGSKTFFWPNGAKLKFRYLKRDEDAENYQGHEYSWIGVEEAGNFPDPLPLDKIRATLRTTNPNIKTWYLMTANPGGVGHNWLKARYVDPAPECTPIDVEVKNPGKSSQRGTWQRIYIPARVEDNKILMDSDPQYIDQLFAASGGKQWLLQAWLKGDWNIVAGGIFDDLWTEEKHWIPPFEIPKSWSIFRAYDWGGSKPFSIGWWAVADGTQAVLADGTRKTYPPDTMFLVKEWYGWTGVPNTGLRMVESEIAQGIADREQDWGWTKRVDDGPADTQIFESISGRQLVDEHEIRGIYWLQANKTPGSRITGIHLIRERLRASLEEPMENPGLFIFNTCPQFHRTFPVAKRDSKRWDDVDTESEDHIIDMTRYAVMYLPAKLQLQDIGLK